MLLEEPMRTIDLAGKIAWQVNLQQEYGEDKMWWDLASSPVIAAGNAAIQVMNAGECYVVALDLADGSVAWKQDRTYETAVESDQGYCSPCVYRQGDREVIVAGGSDHLTGHDARSGVEMGGVVSQQSTTKSHGDLTFPVGPGPANAPSIPAAIN